MKYLGFTLSILSILLLAACDSLDVNGKTPEQPLQAVSKLQPLKNSGVEGEVLFTQEEDLVHVSGIIYGLGPNSRHAFHIHEFGDCGNNGENAGEHFNPLNAPHGQFGVQKHHAGDLPQLRVDENGRAQIGFIADSFILTSVLKRTLIVHIGEDKYTQPSGDAGARIACGIIEKKS